MDATICMLAGRKLGALQTMVKIVIEVVHPLP
jgi:hypothetical protein